MVVSASAPPETPTAPPTVLKVDHKLRKRLIWAAVALGVIAIGVGAWFILKPSGPGPGFVSGNGRIEATEIDISSKLAGPVDDIMVHEGDFVKLGQPLVQMRTNSLLAQRDEARAKHREAITAVASAKAKVAAFESVRASFQATEVQRESDVILAKLKFSRTAEAFQTKAASQDQYDVDDASLRSAVAGLAAAKAQVTAAKAAGTVPETRTGHFRLLNAREW